MLKNKINTSLNLQLRTFKRLNVEICKELRTAEPQTTFNSVVSVSYLNNYVHRIARRQFWVIV